MSYPLGVQSFTYRNFTIEEMMAEIGGPPVDVVEIAEWCHLKMDDEQAAIDGMIAAVECHGAAFSSWSGPTPETAAEARQILEFAAGLGVSHVSMGFDPEETAVVDAIEAAAIEYQLDVGIHNHGPDSDFETPQDVLAVVEDRAPCLGACVDTGHYFRVGEHPEDVIPVLGDRIHMVHVKDFIDEETELVPGDGNLDMPEMVGLLDEHVETNPPLLVEYEADGDNPTPAVKTALERLQDAVA